MEHTVRNNLKKGMWVDIVLKKDQKTGILTRGRIFTTLGRSPQHHRGIKVKLIELDDDGQNLVGRVQHILSKEELQEMTIHYYRDFLSKPLIFGLFNKKENQFLVFPHTNPKTEKTEQTVLLFDDRELLSDFTLGTSFNLDNFDIREISRNNLLIGAFNNQKVDYFRINGERKVSAHALSNMEKKMKVTNGQ